MTDEQSYWTAVREDADRLAELVEDGEDEYESLFELTDNEMIYYWKQRRCIRWTDNLQAVEDVGISQDQDVNNVIVSIAFYAYQADVMEVYQRNHT